MASDEANIRMTADDREAMAMWRRQYEAVDRLDKKLDQMGQAGLTAGKNMQSAFAQTIVSLVSVDRMISLATSGLKQFVADDLARKAEAGRAQRTYGEAFYKTAEASGAQTPDALLRLDELIRGIAHDTGAKGGAMAIADEITAAESGRGNVPQAQAFETVRRAAEQAPHRETGERQQIVSSSLELQKGFPNLTPEQAVARVVEGYVAARTPSIQEYSKNLAPAVGQMGIFGGGKDDLAYLESLIIGVGQRIGDQEGAVTRTAMINFAAQLKEETAPVLGRNASVREQIEFVQGPRPEAAEIRARLLGPLATEADKEAQAGLDNKPKKAQKGAGRVQVRSRAQAKVALMELFDAESETMDQVATAREKLAASDEEAVRKMLANRAAIEQVPGQKPLQLESRLRGKTEELEMGDEAAGQAGTLIAGVDKAFEKAGADWLLRKMAKWKIYVAGAFGRESQLRTSELILRDYAAQLEESGPGPRLVSDDVTKERARKAALLKEQADVLRAERVSPSAPQQLIRTDKDVKRPGWTEDVNRTDQEPERALPLIDELLVARKAAPLTADQRERFAAQPQQAAQHLNDLLYGAPREARAAPSAPQQLIRTDKDVKRPGWIEDVNRTDQEPERALPLIDELLVTRKAPPLTADQRERFTAQPQQAAQHLNDLLYGSPQRPLAKAQPPKPAMWDVEPATPAAPAGDVAQAEPAEPTLPPRPAAPAGDVAQAAPAAPAPPPKPQTIQDLPEQMLKNRFQRNLNRSWWARLWNPLETEQGFAAGNEIVRRIKAGDQQPNAAAPQEASPPGATPVAVEPRPGPEPIPARPQAVEPKTPPVAAAEIPAPPQPVEPRQPIPVAEEEPRLPPGVSAPPEPVGRAATTVVIVPPAGAAAEIPAPPQPVEPRPRPEPIAAPQPAAGDNARVESSGPQRVAADPEMLRRLDDMAAGLARLDVLATLPDAIAGLAAAMGQPQEIALRDPATGRTSRGTKKSVDGLSALA